MTQQELATAIGLTRTSIANLEAGRQRIPLHILYAIAEALGVAPTVLMPPWRGRDGKPHLVVYPQSG